MRRPTSKGAVPAVLFSMVSVQSGASIAKNLFPVLGASGTSTLRIGLSAIILLFINRPKFFMLGRSQWLHIILYGLLLGGMNLLFYMGIARVPLGLGVTVEFIGPLVLALMGSRRLLDIFWALLACTGILLIVPWTDNHNVDMLGLLYVFLAGICWASYIVMGGKVTKMMRSNDAVAIGMCVAALFILPFGLFSGELANLNPTYLAMGLGVAVFSSAIPFTLDFVGLKNLPAKTFSILMSLHPAFAAIFGLIFLNEYLSINQWLSILCVISASIGTVLAANRESSKIA